MGQWVTHDPCDPSKNGDPFDPWPMTHWPIFISGGNYVCKRKELIFNAAADVLVVVIVVWQLQTNSLRSGGLRLVYTRCVRTEKPASLRVLVAPCIRIPTQRLHIVLRLGSMNSDWSIYTLRCLNHLKSRFRSQSELQYRTSLDDDVIRPNGRYIKWH